jgi:hypothetical protein
MGGIVRCYKNRKTIFFIDNVYKRFQIWPSTPPDFITDVAARKFFQCISLTKAHLIKALKPSVLSISPDHFD